MTKKQRAIFFGLTLFNVSAVFANEVLPEIKDIISPDFCEKFETDGNVKLIHQDNEKDFVLIPECEYKENCEEVRVEKNAKKNIPFVAEMIFKIEKEDLKKNNSGDDNFDISDASRIMQTISKMQGMTYFSNTKNKRPVLYEKAYRVESKENPVKVEDDVSEEADGKTIITYMEDASFGPCKYTISYHVNNNTLHVRFLNIDVMGIGPIKALQQGNLMMNVLVVDCGDCFVLYLGTDVDCIKFPGVKGKLEDSLVSRLEAMYEWFIKQF